MTKTFQSKDTKSSTATARRSAAAHVQAKMKVGSRGDYYEKEADSTASKVVNKKTDLKSTGSGEANIAQGVSRLGSDFGKEKKEEQQAKLQKMDEEKEAQAKEIEKKEAVQKQEEEAQSKAEEPSELEGKVQKMGEEKEAQAKELEKKETVQEQEEETQSKAEESKEPEGKVQKMEEDKEAQAKEVEKKEAVQKQEEEAQSKAEESKEPEGKVQKMEEEKDAQAKEEEKNEAIQKQEEEAQSKKEEPKEPEGKVQKMEEEKDAQAKEEEKNETVQKQEEEKAQNKKEEPKAPEGKVQKMENANDAQAKEEEKNETVQKQEEEEAQNKKEEPKAPEDKVQKMEEEKDAQAKKENKKEAVQKQEEEESAQRKVEPRASVRDKGNYPVINEVEPQLIASKGKGEKMDEAVRTDMEARFGADFSKVKIHTGGYAVDMTSKMEAQAFTSGKNIYFNDGKYDPESLGGKILLAHELTHVIQQGEAEAKVPENKIAEANAERGNPGPMPPDKEAQKAKEELEKEKKEKAEEELEQPEKLNTDQKEGKKPKAKKKRARKKAKTDKKKVVEPKTEVGKFLKEQGAAKTKEKIQGLEKLADNETEKDDAGTKLKQTEVAVVPPTEEGQSKANASQVDTVDKTEAPKPDEEKAKEDLKKSMEQAIPSSLEEADKFKEQGKGRKVGEEVRSSVTADTQEVQTTYQEIENTPEPEPEPTPEVLPAMEVAPETPPLDMGENVIGEVQPEHTDLSEFEKKTDDDMAKEGISEEQLEQVDSGPLAKAKEGRKKQKEKVQKGPEEVKTLEKEQKTKVRTEMKKEEKAEKAKMKAERKQKLKNTQEKQKKTKKTIEDKRKEVTDHINGIYEKTNEAVKKKLVELEKQSLKAFDDGQAAATKAFETNVKRRLDAFKSDRYSGMFGWARWLKDKLLGMDDLPQVKRIFDEEKANFISNIDTLIAKITVDNKKVIQECKDMVQKARETIAEYVANLGPALKDVGQKAQADMQAKLDDLDKQVNAKEEELKKKLEEKKQAAIKAIEEKIEKMKEEMSGLAGKLAALLLAALVKLFKWAVEKIGGNSDTLMAKLDKGVKKIVKSPGKFLGNLGKAVKLGFEQFGKNFKRHLMNGIVEWLTGTMSGSGLEMPEKFDLKGVMHLGLQIMGLTWDKLREKLIKVGKVPEAVVSAAEKGMDVLLQIKDKGLIVLWDMLVEKANELKEKVIEGIKNFALVQIVKAAVTKLLLMLNPAGALLQIALTIYDAVMWFIENIQRIIDFIKSIFNGILEIANGQIGAAASFIENALAKMVPILLSFIARWLKLSGIGKAIQKVIKKVRKPIDKVVNKIIRFLAKKIKKLFGKAKKGAKKVKDGVKKVISWWTKKKKFKDKSGESHTISFKGKGTSAQLMIASTPRTIKTYLASLNIKSSDPLHPKLTQAKDLVNKIQTITRKEVDAKEAKIITDNMTKLSKLLIELGGGSLAKLPKKGEVKWKFKPSPQKESSVDLISSKTAEGGTGPKGTSPEWDYLQANELTKKGDRWVRMHLISEKVGGTGAPKNWTPAQNSDNTGGQVSSFETAVKNLLKKKNGKNQPNVLWIKSKVTSNREHDGLPHFPKTVSFKAGLYFYKENKWKKDATARVAENITVDKPGEGNLPNLSKPSFTSLSKIDPIFTRTVVNRIKEQGKTFDNRTDFKNTMINNPPKGLTDAGVESWIMKFKQEIYPEIANLLNEKRIKLK